MLDCQPFCGSWWLTRDCVTLTILAEISAIESYNKLCYMWETVDYENGATSHFKTYSETEEYLKRKTFL